jgi:hypothetical protein
VEIKFSRHAKRRAKLYGISESLVIDVLRTVNLPEGEHEIIKHVPNFEYPIKIVILIETDIATVITNYPLKKGRKK